ncbi:Glutamyl-tRNA amidotransferase subunit B, mitochondrial [Aureobasidium namibiae CBS 147.97]|uniref:Glutamyl-tRNA(Gln) amidotransferase subunit B, mitochondrial n=1 Tax=Aureobasidium namibiae CBS 147.97 TaxID=1043004 RepID=A0A074XAR4_9PEZI
MPLQPRPITLSLRQTCLYHAYRPRLNSLVGVLPRHRQFSKTVYCPQTAKTAETAVPLRKQLKEEAKQRKKSAKAAGKGNHETNALLDKWELTVGIEVHAELNTAHKLFSTARTSANAEPNEHVARFDIALPGAQPAFQKATLIPALRAALAMNCDIQPRSSWDRKHYFYQDQPNGYQITQYYEPFARNGSLILTLEDGIDPNDIPEPKGSAENTSLTIGIKQIQMEQDTAKTALQPPSTYLLDFNRVSHPLIEIITLPHIHSPATAAATVRKIQSLLRSVDSCVAGMEMGGLRADVNVSVRQRGSTGDNNEYSGVTGLGTRTEIKNLSSFKAVEDAVTAERDRQIKLLEAGGVVEGETRGWTIGSTETTRLRSKEGEVDYRYMPDPDLPPVLISNELVEHLRKTLPELPDSTVLRSLNDFGLSVKDAKTLFSLDDGERLEYCAETIELIQAKPSAQNDGQDQTKVGKLVANWVLHEVGGLLASDGREWSDLTITTEELASLLANLMSKQITARVGKQILQQLYEEDSDERISVDARIDEGNLRLRPISREEYIELAQSIMDENPNMVSAVRDKGQKGKTMWFVGQMVRRAEEGTVEAEKAKEIIEELLFP